MVYNIKDRLRFIIVTYSQFIIFYCILKWALRLSQVSTKIYDLETTKLLTVGPWVSTLQLYCSLSNNYTYCLYSIRRIVLGSNLTFTAIASSSRLCSFAADFQHCQSTTYPYLLNFTYTLAFWSVSCWWSSHW